MSELALFKVAKEALAEMVRVDEVKDVKDHAERVRLYGEQVKDRTLIADATEVIMRAERRLGELLLSAHQTGQLGIGRPAKSNVEGSEDDQEQPRRVTLEEVGISKRMSQKTQQLAKVEPTVFESAITAAREKILSGGAAVVNSVKEANTAQKKARRAEREAQLGAKQVALPDAKFGVIYADPEWRFETFSSETGMDRAADNHYPTSTIEAIKSRDVGSLAADDCVLFLWATVPMLLEGIEVMAAWGFTYKSHFVWNKDRLGTGYWNRNKHELLLVGTRGKIPAPAMGEQLPSVIDAPVGAHSAKPVDFYELIEAYYPSLPKIELNARNARDGWVRWGYEAPDLEAKSLPAASIDHAAMRIADLDPSRIHLANCIMNCGTRIYDGDNHLVLPPNDEFFCAHCAPNAEPSPLTLDQIDDMLRAGDAAKTSLAELVVSTGLTLDQIKKRRGKLGIASRDRQREAVAEANRRRADK